MNPKRAEAHIKSLDKSRVRRYEEYFDTLVPSDTVERFRRWMFAYASVHTGWEANCALYKLLKPLDWLGNAHTLQKRIVESRAGLHNHRTRFIMQFSRYFWKHPEWFQRMPGEAWCACRNRLMNMSPGLGPAKTAFALELIHFQNAGIACFDTHMVQLYDFTAKEYGGGKVSTKVINGLEQHWSATCAKHNVSPITARWIWWDQRQEQPDSRYWAYVLEGDGYAVRG